jgi:hypothetical protein
VTLRAAAQYAITQPVLPDLTDSFQAAPTVTEAAVTSTSDTVWTSPPDVVTSDAVANATPADEPTATEDKPATPKQPTVAEQAEPQETPLPAPAPAEAAAVSVPAPEEPGTTGSINAADTRAVELAPANEPASEPAPDATRTATAPVAESPKPSVEPVTEPAPAAANAEPAPKRASKSAAPRRAIIHRRAARPRAARIFRRASRMPAAQNSFAVGSTNGTPARRTSQDPFPQNN